jgi:hypothetical protein
MLHSHCSLPRFSFFPLSLTSFSLSALTKPLSPPPTATTSSMANLPLTSPFFLLPNRRPLLYHSVGRLKKSNPCSRQVFHNCIHSRPGTPLCVLTCDIIADTIKIKRFTFDYCAFTLQIHAKANASTQSHKIRSYYFLRKIFSS